MPVSTRSRYWALPHEAAPGPEGPVPYLPMRPLPPPPVGQVEARLSGAETVESLAHRFYGRSDAWWFVADANLLRFPLDWRPGDPLTLPQGTGVGRVLRTRRF